MSVSWYHDASRSTTTMRLGTHASIELVGALGIVQFMLSIYARSVMAQAIQDSIKMIPSNVRIVSITKRSSTSTILFAAGARCCS